MVKNFFKNKKNLISALIIVGGVGLSLIIFGPKKGEEAETEKPNFAINVKTMAIGEGESKVAEISKTAILEANNSAEAVAEQAGRISSVNFRVGEFVQKGQILATFDQASTVNSAKVALEDSLANLELAEKNLKRTKDSVDEAIEIAGNNKDRDELELEQARDGGDQDEIELAEADLENSEDAEDKAEEDAEISINTAKIQVAQAEATVRQNRIAYEKSIVRAPISGIVTSKEIDRYDYVSAGTEVAEISGASQLNAKVYLSSFEIDKVSEGDSVQIEIAGKSYPGKIASLSGLANANNNRFEIRIESLEDVSFAANQPAEVKINLKLNPDEKGVFFVPLAAVNIGQKNNIVFIAEDNKAKLVEVELGRTVGSQIEIINGLKEGDQLIIKNNRGLRNGEEIEIK